MKLKKKLLTGLFALGIIGANFSLSNNDKLAGIPSEHSPIKTNNIELAAGIPSEHSLDKTMLHEFPSEH